MAKDTQELLRAVHEAALAITDELRLDVILGRMVEVARELVDARYGAIGVPDGSGGFEKFITSGLSDDEIEAIGPLPRQHGLLALMLEDPRPVRYPDIRQHERFEYWPRAHPVMKSFLGVPIVYRGRIVGSFYLTDKTSADVFSQQDEDAISMLAAHAAIAIQNATLYERSRELTATEERNRLARELHDSVAQSLFNIVLESEVTSTLLEKGSTETARQQLAGLSEQARQAAAEIRALIFELRPADLEREGLATTLRKHLDAVGRVHHLQTEFAVEGEFEIPVAEGREAYRIIQEALNNVIKHAGASSVAVKLRGSGGRLEITVSDDGAGFDVRSATIRSFSLGLTSMEERAKALDGRLTVESRRGQGTTVVLSMPIPSRQRGEVPA
ncbi:MAG TPA: GAF domain-containing sensor histidine kinase [Dehalococcoidia bacterium]|nr:GAF domain-containing sensor histidine kinase [Dehalococcoidia bacterium]